MGHSEGGEVAPLAASRSKAIASMVLLAAPGMSFKDVLILQDGTEAQAKGASETDMALIRGYSRRFYDLVQNAKDQEELVQKTKALQAGLSEAEKKALGYHGWPHLDGASLSLEEVLANPSFKEYLRFDVCPLLRALKCPVLALNGSKDCQVPSRENLTGIARELIAGGNLNFTLRELPNLNHLIQTCRTGATDEYATIQETLSPVAMQAIVDWLKMGW